MEIKDSVAVVAGGGGGFGGESVRALHKAGAKVVVMDMDGAKGRAIADELGDDVVFVETDVTDEASILAALSQAESLGPVRVAIAAHGGPGNPRILDRQNRPAALDGFQCVVDIFLVGTFNVMRLAAASIAKSPPSDDGERGALIMTASIAAFDGTIGQTAYSAAKGGVVGMTLPAARDLAPVGIRVVTIAPGTFLTGAFGEVDPDELEAHWAPSVPFPKRMGRPREYAQLVMQICENRYLNGETIRLDGALRFTPKGA